MLPRKLFRFKQRIVSNMKHGNFVFIVVVMGLLLGGCIENVVASKIVYNDEEVHLSNMQEDPPLIKINKSTVLLQNESEPIPVIDLIQKFILLRFNESVNKTSKETHKSIIRFNKGEVDQEPIEINETVVLLQNALDTEPSLEMEGKVIVLGFDKEEKAFLKHIYRSLISKPQGEKMQSFIDYDGVQYFSCPGPNETFSSCRISRDCNNCAIKNRCPLPISCTPGCHCLPGYYRRIQDGICVTKEECDFAFIKY